MNKDFHIGDVVKIKSVMEQDKLLGVTEGNLAIITFYKGYDEYIVDIVEETYNDISERYEYKIIKDHYYLYGSQLKLYRERHFTSILYACGVHSEIIESTVTQLLDYIAENFDVCWF